MKHFFSTLLAVLIGGIILLVILPIVIIIGIVASVSSEPTAVVEKNSVLILDLSTQIVDRDVTDPSQILNSLVESDSYKSIGLYDVLDNIEKAAVDNNISAIYIKGESATSSIANMSEVRRALMQFKRNSAKPIFYYAATTSQSALYLASVADKVFISPEGYADISGVASNVIFYKDLFDKLDIDVQIFRHGQYKSAVEPYLLNKMSDASRSQMKKYIDAIWFEIRDSIASSRNISPATIDSYADDYNFYTSQAAIDAHLVDSLIYYDQFINYVKSNIGIENNNDISAIDMKTYTSVFVNHGLSYSDNQIAIIYASGEIYDGSNEADYANIYADDLSRTIREARRDSTIKAIVLRVNSPGGSALASDIIWREVEAAKSMKPIVVSMGEYAASGGYYISCAADAILAERSTLTGSIGIFGMIPCYKGTANKIGINIDGVKSNKESGVNVFEPLSKTQSVFMQNMVEHGYQTFIGRCAAGRNMTTDEIDNIGQGRVWAGSDAKEIGLIDGWGGLRDAISLAAQKANIESDYNITQLPVVKDPITIMMQQIGKNAKAFVGSSLFGASFDKYQSLQNIFKVDKPTSFTRLEYNLEIIK